MVVNGKRYSHMTDFCKEYNISITKFRGLIGRGFSPAEALNCIKLQELGKIKKIETPADRKKSPRYEINGKPYNSVNEIAEAYNIPFTTCAYRLKHNMEMDVEVMRKHKIRLEIGDMVFDSARDAAKHFGIIHVTVLKICRSIQDPEKRLKACQLRSKISELERQYDELANSD